jgi:hypothetical protein
MALFGPLPLYALDEIFLRQHRMSFMDSPSGRPLAEGMGREASPSAAVLDSQSVKSAEKGAVNTIRWVTTPPRR